MKTTNQLEKGNSLLKERLNKIKRKKKRKVPKKRTRFKVKIGADMNKQQNTFEYDKHDTNTNEQQIIRCMHSSNDTENSDKVPITANKENSNDQEHTEKGNDINSESGRKRMNYGVDTGDNIKEKYIAPEESSSVPSNIKNLPPISLVVDLNDNMLESYSSQEVIGSKDDENVIVNDEEWPEREESIDRSEDESDAQQHLREICERNGISLVKKGKADTK
ncbi:hypothetical protein HAX54_016084 [Datura stramonium]|uniref:Uncharacterized protein n=1 Tax=Datura stramonium TaxID=4076 RepID=A0ABS8UKA1_DATST|nr:hypothetical protein [Datura stramonium]